MERIAESFASVRADGRSAALMPYLMGGFPDLDTSARIGLAYADGGADLVELGVPFSDPLADGQVIHAAATSALAAGARLTSVLEVGRRLAERVPVVIMCYSNVILARGLDRFADALAATRASGLIVPDLPFEEAPEVLRVCDERGLALVPLVAPTTPELRLEQIGARARGFLYAVSLTGTTGERVTRPAGAGGAGLPESRGSARAAAADGPAQLIARAAAHTEVPVALGFGIATPAQAAAAAEAGADGVIVGTRLVRAAGEALDPVGAVRALVRDFSAALLSGSLG